MAYHEWVSRDGTVKAELESFGDTVDILMWDSPQSGVGNSTRALRELRETYSTIRVRMVTEQSAGFWQRRLKDGLVDDIEPWGG